MSFLTKIFGKPLASGAQKQQALSVLTGVPALGLDAFASIAYGPEAALMILLPLGAAGLHYRRLYKPFIDFVTHTKREKAGRLIAVVIPELVSAHWYERLLHNIHAAGLRTVLFLERDQRTIVITTPWYLRDK